ncbi:MAG: aminotransferase class I/II-fold pyridoxal phosphate-dependent enzyme [Phoenicibacter congonensis]|uniref:Aminotransferase class I/II-fold pyridoxal phosphate-dependent enzyme n=1 Tax=Phoenicibacter congonensis TaxID=1944646 RepID=A0AA43RII6_9ACTN|nr:aminotransferase class I/II-fold pyridoxal phosphate-dependent enzyme [Phoenicibacter congonensis]
MDELQKKYEELKALNLNIDMTRGKPSTRQLGLSERLMHIDISYTSKDNFDIRNYGGIAGIAEARELMGEIMEEPADNVLVLTSSSLQLMYDTVQRAMQFGLAGNTPWNSLPAVKMICPSPGYDRHFTICETFGIEQIVVDMRDDGPDMDAVEKLVAEDESIKGIWLVPQYSNPTGITFSDEVVKRLANMKVAAPDFRIFWDNAYAVHHLYDDAERQDHVLDIGEQCQIAGNYDRYFKLASLSKVTFPGSSIAAIASSPANVAEIKQRIFAQMIGPDKVNQMKHALFLKNKDGVLDHMKKHAAELRPKFEAVERVLARELGDVDYANWTTPRGGYFISFNCKPGTAKRVGEITEELGVKFTKAGSTFPLGDDPKDQNIRIAPSCPLVEEVEQAIEVLAFATKMAAAEA